MIFAHDSNLLNHVHLFCIKSPDYKEELTRLYLHLRPNGLTDRVVKSIEDVTNPLHNSINEKCSRIKSIIQAEVDVSIADQYFITGKGGEPKKITLPRKLVVWE